MTFTYMQGHAYNESDHWTSKANCVGKALELFEYQERGSPLTKDMTHAQRMDLNDTNFQLAGEVCIECPVMLTCRAEATTDEKYWTVRGGEVPGRHLEEIKRYANVGRPPGAKNKDGSRAVTVPQDRVCHRGHDVPGGGRCKECKREKNNIRQREVRRVAKAARDAV